MIKPRTRFFIERHWSAPIGCQPFSTIVAVGFVSLYRSKSSTFHQFAVYILGARVAHLRHLSNEFRDTTLQSIRTLMIYTQTMNLLLPTAQQLTQAISHCIDVCWVRLFWYSHCFPHHLFYARQIFKVKIIVFALHTHFLGIDLPHAYSTVSSRSI